MKFKKGDSVMVVSYEGIKKVYGNGSEYNITKKGFIGEVVGFDSQYVYIKSGPYSYLDIMHEDLDFNPFHNSPLFEALK